MSFAPRACVFLASLLVGAGIVVTPCQAGTVYLVGAQLARSDAASGANTGDAYQYSTNSSTSHSALSLTFNGSTQSTAVSFTLGLGSNTFQLGNGTDGSLFGTLNLFFSDTGASFNPPASPLIGGNLSVVAPLNSAGFSTIAAATPIISYGTSGFMFSPASANGLSSYVINGERITVTNFVDNPSGGSSVTLNVADAPTAVPLPPALWTGLASLGGVALQRLRRRDVAVA